MENSQIKIFETSDDNTSIEVKLDNETVWLNLKQLTELFNRNKSVISRHISNIFKEGELDKISVVAKKATTAEDGKTYQVDFYNLDAIISVGYRVNSKRGILFRIWANNILKEYLIKGYVINQEKLQKQNNQLKQNKCYLTHYIF